MMPLERDRARDSHGANNETAPSSWAAVPGASRPTTIRESLEGTGEFGKHERLLTPIGSRDRTYFAQMRRVAQADRRWPRQRYGPWSEGGEVDFVP